MDAAKFLRDIKDLCYDIKSCCGICPLGELNVPCDMISEVPESDIDELVRLVEEWSEMHTVGCDRHCLKCGKCYNEYWQSQDKEK